MKLSLLKELNPRGKQALVFLLKIPVFWDLTEALLQLILSECRKLDGNLQVN